MRSGEGVWELSSLPSLVSEACCSVVEWWGMCFVQIKREDVEAFSNIVLGNLGGSMQCKVIMDGESCDPKSILAYAIKVEKEVREATSSKEQGASRLAASHPTSWSKPAAGWCTINVDARFLGEWGSGMRLVR